MAKEKNKWESLKTVLDKFKEKEEEEYKTTGKRTGWVSLAQHIRDIKNDANIVQDKPALAKGGYVKKYAKGGSVRKVRY